MSLLSKIANVFGFGEDPAPTPQVVSKGPTIPTAEENKKYFLESVGIKDTSKILEQAVNTPPVKKPVVTPEAQSILSKISGEPQFQSGEFQAAPVVTKVNPVSRAEFVDVTRKGVVNYVEQKIQSARDKFNSYFSDTTNTPHVSLIDKVANPNILSGDQQKFVQYYKQEYGLSDSQAFEVGNYLREQGTKDGTIAPLSNAIGVSQYLKSKGEKPLDAITGGLGDFFGLISRSLSNHWEDTKTAALDMLDPTRFKDKSIKRISTGEMLLGDAGLVMAGLTVANPAIGTVFLGAQNTDTGKAVFDNINPTVRNIGKNLTAIPGIHQLVDNVFSDQEKEELYMLIGYSVAGKAIHEVGGLGKAPGATVDTINNINSASRTAFFEQNPEAKKAFVKASFQVHPDLHFGNAISEHFFKELNRITDEANAGKISTKQYITKTQEIVAQHKAGVMSAAKTQTESVNPDEVKMIGQSINTNQDIVPIKTISDIANKPKIPPTIVQKTTDGFTVLEGNSRAQQALANGETSIQVYVPKGTPEIPGEHVLQTGIERSQVISDNSPTNRDTGMENPARINQVTSLFVTGSNKPVTNWELRDVPLASLDIKTQPKDAINLNAIKPTEIFGGIRESKVGTTSAKIEVDNAHITYSQPGWGQANLPKTLSIENMSTSATSRGEGRNGYLFEQLLQRNPDALFVTSTNTISGQKAFDSFVNRGLINPLTATEYASAIGTSTKKLATNLGYKTVSQMNAEHNFYEVVQPEVAAPAETQKIPRQQSFLTDLHQQMADTAQKAEQVSAVAQQATDNIVGPKPEVVMSLKNNPEAFVTDYSSMEFNLESGAKRSPTNIAMGLGSAAAQVMMPTQIATLTGPYSTAINTLFPLESVGIFGPQGILEFAQNKETGNSAFHSLMQIEANFRMRDEDVGKEFGLIDKVNQLTKDPVISRELQDSYKTVIENIDDLFKNEAYNRENGVRLNEKDLNEAKIVTRTTLYGTEINGIKHLDWEQKKLLSMYMAISNAYSYYPDAVAKLISKPILDIVDSHFSKDTEVDDMHSRIGQVLVDQGLLEPAKFTASQNGEFWAGYNIEKMRVGGDDSKVIPPENKQYSRSILPYNIYKYRFRPTVDLPYGFTSLEDYATSLKAKIQYETDSVKKSQYERDLSALETSILKKKGSDSVDVFRVHAPLVQQLSYVNQFAKTLKNQETFDLLGQVDHLFPKKMRSSAAFTGIVEDVLFPYAQSAPTKNEILRARKLYDRPDLPITAVNKAKGLMRAGAVVTVQLAGIKSLTQGITTSLMFNAPELYANAYQMFAHPFTSMKRHEDFFTRYNLTKNERGHTAFSSLQEEKFMKDYYALHDVNSLTSTARERAGIYTNTMFANPFESAITEKVLLEKVYNFMKEKNQKDYIVKTGVERGMRDLSEVLSDFDKAYRTGGQDVDNFMSDLRNVAKRNYNNISLSGHVIKWLRSGDLNFLKKYGFQQVVNKTIRGVKVNSFINDIAADIKKGFQDKEIPNFSESWRKSGDAIKTRASLITHAVLISLAFAAALEATDDDTNTEDAPRFAGLKMTNIKKGILRFTSLTSMTPDTTGVQSIFGALQTQLDPIVQDAAQLWKIMGSIGNNARTAFELGQLIKNTTILDAATDLFKIGGKEVVTSSTGNMQTVRPYTFGTWFSENILRSRTTADELALAKEMADDIQNGDQNVFGEMKNNIDKYNRAFMDSSTFYATRGLGFIGTLAGLLPSKANNDIAARWEVQNHIETLLSFIREHPDMSTEDFANQGMRLVGTSSESNNLTTGEIDDALMKQQAKFDKQRTEAFQIFMTDRLMKDQTYVILDNEYKHIGPLVDRMAKENPGLLVNFLDGIISAGSIDPKNLSSGKIDQVFTKDEKRTSAIYDALGRILKDGKYANQIADDFANRATVLTSKDVTPEQALQNLAYMEMILEDSKKSLNLHGDTFSAVQVHMGKIIQSSLGGSDGFVKLLQDKGIEFNPKKYPEMADALATLSDFNSEPLGKYPETPIDYSVAGKVAPTAVKDTPKVEDLKDATPGAVVPEGAITDLGTPLWANGVEIKNKKGSPIHAPVDAIVTYSGYVPGFGNVVRLKDVNGFTIQYAHLDGVIDNITPGLPIAKGEQFATMGNSGDVMTVGQDGNDVTLSDDKTGKAEKARLASEKKLDGTALDVTIYDHNEIALPAPITASYIQAANYKPVVKAVTITSPKTPETPSQVSVPVNSIMDRQQASLDTIKRGQQQFGIVDPVKVPTDSFISMMSDQKTYKNIDFKQLATMIKSGKKTKKPKIPKIKKPRGPKKTKRNKSFLSQMLSDK